MTRTNSLTKVTQRIFLILLFISLLTLIFVNQSVGSGDITQMWWIQWFKTLLQMNVVCIVWALISIKMGQTKNLTWHQSFRCLVMLIAVAYLGFANKGCSCAVSYFQSSILFLLGKEQFTALFVIFCALMVMTYVYGKVWCGWLCPLGIVQDFLYIGRFKKLRNKTFFKALRTRTAQTIMRTLQVISFIGLTVMVIITQMPYFCRFDPFAAIFRLNIFTTTQWILVIVLIISSLLICRPFCKSFCPMGLVLNLVTLIPGSHRITVDSETCKRCGNCGRKCQMNAIRNHKIGADCIHCGECIGSTQCESLKA
ncbi:MAG: 4Fe-4S binding protein [Bacteroidales bacterium]|nr:4Fe-4S binding protein [Bacteroidales bacterium]